MSDRDCQHGQLTRVCDRCADAAEIEQLRAELAHYTEAATKLSAETYDLEAELTACREREARLQWQPIETAPKDGTLILLAGWHDGPDDWRIKTGYWAIEDGDWYIFGGSWRPARWMPLDGLYAALAEGAQR